MWMGANEYFEKIEVEIIEIRNFQTKLCIFSNYSARISYKKCSFQTVIMGRIKASSNR